MRGTLGTIGVVAVQALLLVPHAGAQSGLSQAVLALPSTLDGSSRRIEGHLYGAEITATISDADQNARNFGTTDRISLTIGPRHGAGQPLVFSGPRTSTEDELGFEDWARDHADDLLALLFPAGLSSSVIGRGAAELHAQQLLLTTALATEGVRNGAPGRRAFAGGLVDFEWLRADDRRPGDSAWAWQGLYSFTRALSVQGRWQRQREGFTTNAVTALIDYHPYVEIERTLRWRIGGTARGGVLYSRSNAFDLGSVEFGGGGWVSVFKDLGRVRLGGGTLIQAADSYVPSAFGGDGDLSFLVDVINDRGVEWDLSYGATAGVDTSARTALVVKVLQNRALTSAAERSDSTLLLAGLSYSLGLPSINVGYKLYSASALRGHSLFLQGNFNW